DLIGHAAFSDVLGGVDQLGLVRPGRTARPGEIPLHLGGARWGAFASAHAEHESLSARVLLENLSVKASAVHAVKDLLGRTQLEPASITLAIGCGEEAIGDRYQRGGGNLAKAVAEHCGLANASGIDVKS